MQNLTIPIPLVVDISKKSKFYINLNQYRNAHFHILNKAKVEFDRIVRPLLIDVPSLDSTQLTYTLYAGTKRAADIANICSVADKFFSDTLVGAGKLSDDTFYQIPQVHYVFGGYEAGKTRLEVTLHDYVLKTKDQPMRIILTPNEVQTALLASLAGILNEDLKTEVVLKEGPEGVYAEIEVTAADADPTEATEKPAPKPRGRRKAVQVTEATEEPEEPAEAAVETPELTPNQETQEAMQDTDTVRATSVDALFEDIKTSADEEEPFAVTPEPAEEAVESRPTPIKGLFGNLATRQNIRDANAEA